MANSELDRELKRRGWRYDAGDEVFRDGNGRRLDYRRVVNLVPGMTLDELASYQDGRADKRWAKLAKRK
jgi:hypothetical protein